MNENQATGIGHLACEATRCPKRLKEFDMARFWDVLAYADELVLVIGALQSYRGHQDESRLAEELSDILYKLADEATDGKAQSVVDRVKVRDAVGQLVDVLEDVLKL